MKPTSFDCNLACTHCYYRNVEELYPDVDHPRMTLDVVDAVCQQYRLLEPQNINIGWQGGEPTMMGLDFFRKVIDIETQNARPGDCWGNSLQTNGVLLNDDWCRFLAKNHFLIGLSIDGPGDLNTLRRFPNGKETYEQTMNALSLLEKHECEYNILFVISKLNWDRPVDLFNFLVENGLHFSQFIPCTEPAGGGAELTEHSITADQYAKFQTGLFDAWVDNDDPSFYVRHIDNWLHLFFGLMPEMCEYRADCSNLITVEWNGDVYPCDFFVKEEFKMGNVLNKTIEQMLHSKAWKSFTSQAEEIPDDCDGCEWLKACHGGCYRQRKKLGIAQQSKPYFCEANKQIFEHVFDRLDQLSSKRVKPNLYDFLQEVAIKRVPQMIAQQRNNYSSPVNKSKKTSPAESNTDKINARQDNNKAPGRNDPCLCGSGKKFKKCCFNKIAM